MAEPTAGEFGCPSCGRRFAWAPQYRGRKVRCGCGIVFEPGQVEEAARAATAASMESAKAARMAREHREQSAAVAAAAAAFPTRTRRGQEFAPDEAPSPMRNFYLPVAMLGLGGLLWFGQGLLAPAVPGRGIVFNIAVVAVGMACNIAVMLAAMFVAAYVLGVNYGPIGQVVLKLAAMAVICGAIFLLIAQLDYKHSLRGPILAWHVVVLLYWMFFAILFDLDVQETVMSVAIVAMAQAVVAWIVMH
jgi:hypothetical protein